MDILKGKRSSLEAKLSLKGGPGEPGNRSWVWEELWFQMELRKCI